MAENERWGFYVSRGALVPFDVIRPRAQYFWTLWLERVKILPRGISLSSGREHMTLTQIRCAQCGCKNIESYRTYTIRDGEQRMIYHCSSCDSAFSETRNTPIAQLKTPIAVIVQVLSALTEGVGINAATRLYGVSKNSIYRWQERLSGLKKPCSCLP
jgi:transposase-like protein